MYHKVLVRYKSVCGYLTTPICSQGRYSNARGKLDYPTLYKTHVKFNLNVFLKVLN